MRHNLSRKEVIFHTRNNRGQRMKKKIIRVGGAFNTISGISEQIKQSIIATVIPLILTAEHYQLLT